MVFNAAPSTSETQDLVYSAHARSAGVTSCTFTRKRNTGDNNDRVIGPGTTNIIWALAPDDNPTQMHTLRGRQACAPIKSCLIEFSELCLTIKDF